MQCDRKNFFPVLILNFIALVIKFSLKNMRTDIAFLPPRAQENSIKYLGKYSTKCLKSKVFPDFCTIPVCMCACMCLCMYVRMLH